MKLSAELLQTSELTTEQKLLLSLRLSVPAILAQLTSIMMQYIDAAMVGQLGADASAAIGLVSSTIWLFGGVGMAASYGFSVQIAHAVGAGDTDASRHIFRQGLAAVALFGLLLGALGVGISGPLPRWLGADASLQGEASRYLLIYMCALPMAQLSHLAGASLQASGNMKVPSILNSLMCVLDVIFNLFLIFPSGTVALGWFSLPGAGLGVAGAAAGTALAHLVIALGMLFAAGIRAPSLTLLRTAGEVRPPFHPDCLCLKKAFRIGTPIALEQAALCGAMVVTTRIVAPLGAVSIAANSFAITAESLCYMPGYGLAAAATTLVGQSVGAGRRDLARSFGWITVFLGMGIMTLSGLLMYFASPAVFRFLTPDAAVQALGVRVLRIELFAEPLFAASIVASGALRGAGDTLIPSLMNLASIWGVRLTLSALLVGSFGLTGVWVAMCAELCFRGAILLGRMKFGKWMSEGG